MEADLRGVECLCSEFHTRHVQSRTVVVADVESVNDGWARVVWIIRLINTFESEGGKWLKCFVQGIIGDDESVVGQGCSRQKRPKNARVVRVKHYNLKLDPLGRHLGNRLQRGLDQHTINLVFLGEIIRLHIEVVIYDEFYN